MTQHIAIIGAGPTGLGAAWRLHELGYDNWALYEREPEAGGLAASFTDDRGFTWDVGGHVMFSHYDYFDRLMQQALSDQWLHHERESWVWIQDRFVPYPFQYNVRHLPREAMWDCVRGLVRLYKQDSGAGDVRSFRDWILSRFGEGIAQHFLFPYNWKVWAWPLERMDYRWTGERVAVVDLERLLDNILNERDDVGWGPNNTFKFPIHGGTGAIWRALASQLPQERIHLGREVTGIDPTAKRLQFEDGEDAQYDLLINTMPLDRLVEVAGLDDLKLRARSLEHNGVHIFGIGLAGQKPAHLDTKCWMYFPENDNPFFRCTVFVNYSPNNVPDASRYWSLMAEVAYSPHRPADPARVADEVIDGLRATKLIAPEDEIVSLWHYDATCGYPVPTLGRDKALGVLQPALERLGIYSRGRFGAWVYEVGNMDHSAMQGVEVVDRLLQDGGEPTLTDPNKVNAPRS